MSALYAWACPSATLNHQLAAGLGFLPLTIVAGHMTVFGIISMLKAEEAPGHLAVSLACLATICYHGGVRTGSLDIHRECVVQGNFRAGDKPIEPTQPADPAP